METDNLFEWIDDNGQSHAMRVQGHLMLVRKCEHDESKYLVGDSGAELNGDARLILDSLTKGKPVNFCEVLAVGAECGKPRALREMARFRMGRDASPPYYVYEGRKYGVPRCLNNPAKVGDFVVLPEASRFGRMWRGVTGSPHDVMIDEAEMIALYPADKEA